MPPVPKSRPKGGGRQPARSNDALVWTAKNKLTWLDVPKTPKPKVNIFAPSPGTFTLGGDELAPTPLQAALAKPVVTQAPLKPTIATPPPPSQKKASAQQVDAAKRVLVPVDRPASKGKPALGAYARPELAATLTPAEKRALRQRAVPVVPPPPRSVTGVPFVRDVPGLPTYPSPLFPGSTSALTPNAAFTPPPTRPGDRVDYLGLAKKVGGQIGKIAEGIRYDETHGRVPFASETVDVARALGERAARKVPGALTSIRDSIASMVPSSTEQSTAMPYGRVPQQGAGFLPAPVAEGIGKLAVGAAAAVPGAFAHPIRALHEAGQVIRGTGDMAVMGLMLPNPAYSTKQKLAIADALYHGSLDYIRQNYGENVTWRQAVQNGWDQPLNHLADFLTVAAPGAGALEVIRLLKMGKTLGEALRISRDPSLLGETDLRAANEYTRRYVPRQVTVRQRHGVPDTVVALPSARSPLGRWFQHGVDVTTGAIERAAGRTVGPMIPFTPTRRGLKQRLYEQRRTNARLAAEMQALTRDYDAYLREKGIDPETERGRLFYAHQKPADIPDEVWFKALLEDTRRRLDEQTQSGRPMTATERRLDNEIKRLTKQAQTASNNRWKNLVEDVHGEKIRLSRSLFQTERDLVAMRERARLAASGETTRYEETIAQLLDERRTADPARQREIDRAVERLKDEGDYPDPRAAAEDVKVLESKRNALRAQLSDMTVAEEPLKHPNRSRYEAAIKDTPEVTDEQRHFLLQAQDAVARHWGRIHGVDPAEYYGSAQFVHDFRRLEEEYDLPEAAFAQVRESAIAANANRLDPENAFPRSDSGRLYYNEDHHRLVTKLEKAETKDAEVKARLPGKANAKHPERIAAADALTKAREDELYARVHYGSRTHTEGVSTSPERRSLAERLVKTYKGRSGALPRGVKTAADLERVMSLLDELTVRGREARYWYENSAKAIKKLANGDKELAARIAQLVAIYSPQKAVIPNMGEAIKAYNAWRTNREIPNGLDWQKDAARKVLDGEGDWNGRKTNNFYMNFLEDIDKRKYNRERKLTAQDKKELKKKGIDIGRDTLGEVTSDMWMARVFGYLSTHVTGGRYDVIEAITRQLAKEHGWKPKQVQAAVWTAIKDISDDVSANVDFADAIARHHGIVNYEVAPGTIGGDFRGVYDGWDTATQQAYLGRFNSLVGEFLARSGILHRGPDLGPGLYEGTASPGARIRLVSGGRDYIVPEGDRAMFRYVTAAIGRAGLQDSTAWARAFLPKSIGHGETVSLHLGRAATEEEALRLYNLLNPEGQPERVFVVHAGNDGIILRRNPGLTQAEYPNYAVAKAKRADTFQQQANDAIAEVYPGKTGTIHVSDGELIEARNYDAVLESALGDAGRPDEALRLRESADRLASEAEALRAEIAADPTGAAERYPGESAAARRATGSVSDGAPRGPPEPEPEPVLAQTRQGDILGASHFLTTTEGGRRILYYSQQADVSTWLHEMFGHAVNELKASHPEEFQAVEDMIGKPLEEWDRSDHERFARMAETYFMSGRAPTPELVTAFKDVRRWMKTIYGAQQSLGVQLHPAVRDLLDTYFGSYADENVYRVAQMMTSPQDLRAGSEIRAVREYTSKKLADLRRRNDVAAYKRSLAGLEAEVRRQAKAIEEAGGWDAVDAATREKMTETTAVFHQAAAAAEVAKIDRETGLRNRIALLENILANPAGEGYQAALDALGSLMDLREGILREAFGDDFMDNRADRVDLLADWLADQKLIPSDFARGTARYAPHEQFGYGQRPRLLNRPGQPLNDQVIGAVDTKLLNLYSRNHLIRWQNGDLTADPKVIIDAALNAQAYAFATRVKNAMWDIARPMMVNEVVDDGAIIINKNGTPISGLHKRPPSMTVTEEAQAAMDGIAGRDLNAIEQSVKGYLENVFIDGKKLNEYVAATGEPIGSLGVRVLDRRVMESMTRPLSGSSRGFLKPFEFINTIARHSLIYTNPAYIPVNLLGNLLFLTATGGPRGLANLVSAARMLHSDKAFADLVAAEVGELPAQAAISHGRGARAWTRYFRRGEEKFLHGLTYVPDRFPRIASWVTEAQKLGYHTKADQLRLLKGETAKLRRDREIIADRANNNMVNFSLAGDAEKMAATKLLFIWPWIRGATAWPFYYAREFPLATGALSVPGRVFEQRRQNIMGNVSPAASDYIPLGANGKAVERVLNVAPFSPGSTAAQSVDTIVNIIESIMQGHKPVVGLRAGDYSSPLIDIATELATGFDQYGRQISMRDALLDFGFGMIPFTSSATQTLIDPSKASKVYRNRTRLDIISRKWLRFTPQDVSLVTLHSFQKGEPKTTQQKVNDKVAALVEQRNKLGGTEPISNSVRYALQIQQSYEDRQAIEQKKIKSKGVWYPTKEGQTEPTLTGRQRLAIAEALVGKYRGQDVANGLPRPVDLDDETAGQFADALLYGSKKYRIDRVRDALLGPLNEYRDALAKVRREQSGSGG